MATTTNYGWETPDNTDLVRDGAEAIRDLGNAIDNTVYLNSELGSGLTLISTTTIGTAVASVAVTGAFNATYDNYRIVVSGGTASNNGDLQMILGATTTGYYWSGAGLNFSSGAVSGAGNNSANWVVGGSVSNGIIADVELKSPQLARRTIFSGSFYRAITSGFTLYVSGFLDNATQYTGFTFQPGAGGTLTGGQIRVYGYQN